MEENNVVGFDKEDIASIQSSMMQIEQTKADKKKLEDIVAVLSTVIEDYKKQIQCLQDGIDSLNEDVLNFLTNNGLNTFTLREVVGENAPDLTAEVFVRTTNVFEDAKVLTFLKNLGTHPECINIKESLKKRDLNKAIKSDQFLADKLEQEGLIGTNTTKYVVVASSETIAQMHEHMKTEE